MEWKYFFAIPAYILTVCDLVLGAPTIINVTLVDGETPNEGRVDYFRSEPLSRETACGDHIGYTEASVICRQLGYPGVNEVLTQWPFGNSNTVTHHRVDCMGEEEYLANCSLVVLSSACSNTGGVICYERGYIGCYSHPASPQSSLGDLQTPCANGVQDLTIPKCVSLCHHTSDSYTYAGLYQGNMCLCGNPSTAISQAERVDDRFCSSSCAGRNIERCGGDSHIAMFNIASYLQNTNRIASPPECAEPTPTQTEGDVTATLSIHSSSSTPPPSAPSMPSSDRTTTEVHSIGLTTTVHAVLETNNPTQSTRELATTNIYSTLSSGTSTQSENCTCIQKAESSFSSIVSKGVQIGLIVVVVALLLYAIAITFLLIQLRRKVPTRTKETRLDPYMDLQPRPEADRTYQEMAITSTASSKNPGESRLPSPNLVYENQNVAQYANKIKEGADYEDVHTPN